MKKYLKFIFVFLLIGVSMIWLSSKNDVFATQGDFFNISTNMAQDASTGANICFQSSNQTGYVVYTTSDDASYTNGVNVTPNYEKIDYSDQTEAMSGFHDPTYKCTVELRNLTPGVRYRYKVVNGSNSSDDYFFTTADNTSEFTFSAMSDPQFYGDASAKAWYDCMDLAYDIEPNLAFNVICGDLVERGVDYNHWRMAFAASTLKNNYFVTTPGNHEYYTNDTKLIDNRFYSSMFNNPDNGASNCLNSSYYFMYNNTLFISIDSECKENSTWKTQKQWFEEVVHNNPSQFIIVYMHTSIYGSVNDQETNGSRDYTNSGTLRRAWVSTFDKFGVDLVLTGHDHVYLRSNKLYNNQVTTESNLGTYYVTTGCAGSSLKYSEDLCDKELNAVRARETCFGVVRVTNKAIFYVTYNSKREIIDSFSIAAKRTGTVSSSFSQETFKDSITLHADNSDRSNAILSWDSTAYGNVKSIELNTGSSTKHIATISSDLQNSQVISGFTPDTKYNYYVIITYLDNTTEKFLLPFDTLPYFGEISDIEISEDDTTYTISWNQSMDKYCLYVSVLVNGAEVTIVNGKAGTGKALLEKSTLLSNNNIQFVGYSTDMQTTKIICEKELTHKLPKEDPVITIPELTKTIFVGEKYLLNATVNEDYVLKYSSTDETIATVDENGNVLALKEGTVTVRVFVEGETEVYKEVNITINKKVILPTNITVLSNGNVINSSTMIVNDTLKLDVLLTPETATETGVVWSSSDQEIATVNDGTVTALKEGTVTITVATVANSDVKVDIVITIEKAEVLPEPTEPGENPVEDEGCFSKLTAFYMSLGLLVVFVIRMKKTRF